MVFITFLIIGIGLIIRNFYIAHILFYDWDEGMYAQIAHEILKNKSLFTTFNGHIWLDKPPLAHSLIALMFSIFGNSEFWARFIMICIAFILLILTYFASRKIYKIFSKDNHYGKELIIAGLIPVLLLAASPIFIERSTLLNSDTLIAVSWIGYFISWNNYFAKLFFLTLGVWSKSVLGLYPVFFEVPYWAIQFIFNKKEIKKHVSCLRLLVIKVFFYIFIPSLWYIAGLLKFGNTFIYHHFESQVLKRVTVPIELHFGNKFYYFSFLWEKLGLINILFVISYMVFLYQLIKIMKKNHQKIISPNILPIILLLLSPFPFLAFLTLMKTKIYWYVIIFFPIITLSLTFLYVHLKNALLRKVFLFGILLYFVLSFFPQTFFLKINYEQPEKLKLAKCLAQKPFNTVAFLVDNDERKIKNVLEAAHYDTTSSFYYGGSPSFVFYVQKKVDYFYNVDEFIKQSNQYNILIISKTDLKNINTLLQVVGSGKITCDYSNWLSIVK